MFAFADAIINVGMCTKEKYALDGELEAELERAPRCTESQLKGHLIFHFKSN